MGLIVRQAARTSWHRQSDGEVPGVELCIGSQDTWPYAGWPHLEPSADSGP